MFTALLLATAVVTASAEGGASLRTAQGNVVLSVPAGKTFSVQCPELADGRNLACQGETVRQQDGQCKSITPLCDGNLVTLNNENVCVPKLAGCDGASVELDGKGGCRAKVAGCVGALVEVDSDGNCRPKTQAIDTRVNVLVDSKASVLEASLNAKVSASVVGLEATEGAFTKKVDTAVAGLESTEDEVIKKVNAALASLTKTLEDGASSVGVTLSTFTLLYTNEKQITAGAALEVGPEMEDKDDYFSGDGVSGNLRSRHQRDFAVMSKQGFIGDFTVQYNTGPSLYPIVGFISTRGGWRQDANPLNTYREMRSSGIQHDRAAVWGYDDNGNRQQKTNLNDWKNNLIQWQRIGSTTLLTAGPINNPNSRQDVSNYIGKRQVFFTVGHHNGPAQENVRLTGMKVRDGPAVTAGDHLWTYAGSSATHLLLGVKDVRVDQTTMTFSTSASGVTSFTAQPEKEVAKRIANGGKLVSKRLTQSDISANFKDAVTVTLFCKNLGTSLTKISQIKLSVSRNDGANYVTQAVKNVGRWGSSADQVAFTAKVDLSKAPAGSQLRVMVEVSSQEFKKSAIGFVGVNVEF